MSRPAFPGFALSTGLLWLLTGALYKLFDGSPNDLPPSVVEQSPLDMFGTFRSAIAIELAVVGLVIALPRVGWVFLAGTFATFLAILTPLAMSGAESCGCFGSNVTIKPWQMMTIDGALLLLLLVSKPWRMPKDSGLGGPAFVPFLVMAIAAPTMKLERGELPEVQRPDGVATIDDVTNEQSGDAGATEGTGDGTPPEDGDTTQPVEATNLNGDGTPIEGGPSTTDPGTTDPGTGGGEPVVSGSSEDGPAEPEFWELKWREWQGKDFYETDLASFADQSQGAVMPNSHVIIYRQTCEVCQEHLEQLWEESQNDPTKWAEKTLVLVRIIETKDTPENNVCQVLPEPSQKVTLPALRRGYGITTPLAFDVDETMFVQNVTDVRELLGH